MSEFSINFNAGDELVDLLNNKFAIYPENNDDGALLKEVLTFTMFWMAFENGGCIKADNVISHVETAYKKQGEKDEALNKFSAFIATRYKDAKLLEKLKLTENSDLEKSLIYLTENPESANMSQKIEACSAVIIRYRNNLFHGTKFHNKFDSDADNLCEANKFLYSLLT